MARQHDFSVSTEDIEEARLNGGEGDSFRCVVVEAIKRQRPEAHHIEVDIQTIRWSDKNGRHVWLTPYEVAGYIVAFDAGEEIHPFGFRLRAAVKTVQRKPLTETAKAVKDAENKMTTARRSIKSAQAVIKNPESSKAEVAMAEERQETAEQLLQKAKERRTEIAVEGKASGEKVSPQRTSPATRKIPKVTKKRTRTFGVRDLRVNQGEDRTHYISERA